MKATTLALLLVLSSSYASGQRLVSFSLPGHPQQLQADVYGAGRRALLLAHGGRFNKESWMPQAEVFAKAGFLVLALKFRGDTLNKDGSPSAEGSAAENAEDVSAAFSYLRSIGVTSISAMGASLGGDAVGEADAKSKPGEIDRVIFLGSSGSDYSADLKGRKLFIVARDDTSGSGLRLPEIQAHFNKVPQPKQLIILDGSAHAQFLFPTAQGSRLMTEILTFLSAP